MFRYRNHICSCFPLESMVSTSKRRSGVGFSLSSGSQPQHLSARGVLTFFFLVHLLVERIQPVNWNKIAFEQLVLPKRTKNLVKALVMVRKQKLGDSGPQIGLKGKCDDIIAGKGSGLIMLLHGGPGTGKTLTAGKIPYAVLAIASGC